MPTLQNAVNELMQQMNFRNDVEIAHRTPPQSDVSEIVKSFKYGIIKPILRGGTVGAVGGLLYGLTTGSDLGLSVKIGAGAGAMLDSAQLVIRYSVDFAHTIRQYYPR